MCQFAVDPGDLDLAYHDIYAWSGVSDNHRKRTWPGKSRKGAGDHGKGLHIPRLTEVSAFDLFCNIFSILLPCVALCIILNLTNFISILDISQPGTWIWFDLSANDCCLYLQQLGS